MILHAIKIVLASLLFTVLQGCADQGKLDDAETASNEPFSIRMISDRAIDTLPYDYRDAVWQDLLRQPSAAEVLITDEDIDAYDEKRQALLLTRSASTHLTEETVRGLNERAFMVFLQDKPVFAGAFIKPVSARAIRYPVIYTFRLHHQWVFCIRPEHSPSTAWNNTDNAVKERLAPAEIKRHFARQGKLQPLTDQAPCRGALL